MSNIGGKLKEQAQLPEFTKKVGLFEAQVIAVNPTAEEYKDLLDIELKEDSKAVEYLGQSPEGNTKLRLDFWLKEIKSGDKFKLTFFLENKEKENKDGTKKQYINAVGTTTWSEDADTLPDWFAKRDYRVAFVGEDELYNFLRTWLGNLDYRDAETTLQLDWKPLMKGNVKDLKHLVGGPLTTSIVAMATIKTVVKEDQTREYQGVYNKGFLPSYSLKSFRLVNYTDAGVVDKLRKKKSKDLKPHERFVVNITGEYGCKDFFVLKDLRDYNAGDNFVASDKAIADDDSTY